MKKENYFLLEDLMLICLEPVLFSGVKFKEKQPRSILLSKFYPLKRSYPDSIILACLISNCVFIHGRWPINVFPW